MKRIIYISSFDETFNYPQAHTTLENALQYNPKKVVKVFVEVPVEEQETIAESA